MRLLTIAAYMSTLFCFQVCICEQADAQHFKKSGADAPVNYKPSDPWKRGRVFNLQTGNSGFFYNCDGEQNKRCSPYICWKPDDEPMFPPFFEPLKMWKEQLDTVRQRVIDGSCSGPACGCADCQTAIRNGQNSGCAACLQAAALQSGFSKNDPAQPPAVDSAVAKTASPRSRVVDPGHGVKYGLVRGTIIEPKTTEQVAAPGRPKGKESSVAKRSLLNQLRGIKRR